MSTMRSWVDQPVSTV